MTDTRKHSNGNESESEPNSDTWLLLESFPAPHEAHLAANALKAVQIPVKIVDESTVGLMPHLEVALGGVKVFVQDKDLEDAIRILRGDADLADQPYRQPADEPPTDLLDSDERDTNLEEEMASRAFRASIFGLFLCPVVLHLYSVALLFRIRTTWTERSPRARSRERIAWTINGIVLVLALITLLHHSIK